MYSLMKEIAVHIHAQVVMLVMFMETNAFRMVVAVASQAI